MNALKQKTFGEKAVFQIKPKHVHNANQYDIKVIRNGISRTTFNKKISPQLCSITLPTPNAINQPLTENKDFPDFQEQLCTKCLLNAQESILLKSWLSASHFSYQGKVTILHPCEIMQKLIVMFTPTVKNPGF